MLINLPPRLEARPLPAESLVSLMEGFSRPTIVEDYIVRIPERPTPSEDTMNITLQDVTTGFVLTSGGGAPTFRAIDPWDLPGYVEPAPLPSYLELFQ